MLISKQTMSQKLCERKEERTNKHTHTQMETERVSGREKKGDENQEDFVKEGIN